MVKEFMGVHRLQLFDATRAGRSPGVRLYGLDAAKMKEARKDAIIMHPGPINRGIEIDPQLADGPYSVILDQVSNGVAIRMALLYLILGEQEDTEES